MFASEALNRIMDGKKGIIFDLDGTLTDSVDVWREVDREFFGRRGIRYDAAAHTAATSEMTSAQIAEYVVSKFGLAESPAEV